MSRKTPLALDAKLDWMNKRVAATIDLALEKVVAHHKKPDQYPLPPDPRSLEQSLHNVLNAMPAVSRRKLIDKVNKTLDAPASERKRIYGDLADLNFRAATALIEQVKSLPVPAEVKITEKEMVEIGARYKPSRARTAQGVKGRKGARATPAQTAEATELGFEVVSLKCIRPTDLRKDEVNLAAFAVDNLGGEFQVEPFFVGNFKKGETIELGQQGRLFNFKLTEGQFPKTFTAGIFLVEKDLLRNNDLVNALISFFFVASAALTVIALGMLAVGMAGGPFSGLLFLALLIGASIMGLTSSIMSFMRDDFSFDITDAIVFDSPIAPGTSFERGPSTTIIGEIRGEYEAIIRWVTA